MLGTVEDAQREDLGYNAGVKVVEPSPLCFWIRMMCESVFFFQNKPSARAVEVPLPGCVKVVSVQFCFSG